MRASNTEPLIPPPTSARAIAPLPLRDASIAISYSCKAGSLHGGNNCIVAAGANIHGRQLHFRNRVCWQARRKALAECSRLYTVSWWAAAQRSSRIDEYLTDFAGALQIWTYPRSQSALLDNPLDSNTSPAYSYLKVEFIFTLSL